MDNKLFIFQIPIIIQSNLNQLINNMRLEEHENLDDEPQSNQNCSENCSHDHGSHSSPQQSSYWKYFPFYCVSTLFFCTYLNIFEFNKYNPNAQLQKYLPYVLAYIAFTSAYCFYRGCTVSTAVIKLKNLPEHMKTTNKKDQKYQIKYCDKCHYHKAPRVSHCKTCGTCMYKMDHHCMFTSSCVGYTNYNFFVIGMTYMFFTLVAYWIHFSYVYRYSTNSIWSQFSWPILALTAWTTVSASWKTLFCGVLVIAHNMSCPSNYTSLDVIKNKKVCKWPYCQFRWIFLTDDRENVFERGQIQTLKQIIGNNILYLIFPMKIQINNEWCPEKMHPYPNQRQIKKFLGQLDEQVVWRREMEKSILGVKERYSKMKFKVKQDVVEFE